MALRTLNAFPPEREAGSGKVLISVNGKTTENRAVGVGDKITFSAALKRVCAALDVYLLLGEDAHGKTPAETEKQRVKGVWSGLENGFDLYRFPSPIPYPLSLHSSLTTRRSPLLKTFSSHTAKALNI